MLHSKAQWRSWLARRPVTAKGAGSSPVWVAPPRSGVSHRTSRPGSSVGTSDRLKSGRSAVRPRPWPHLPTSGSAGSLVGPRSPGLGFGLIPAPQQTAELLGDVLPDLPGHVLVADRHAVWDQPMRRPRAGVPSTPGDPLAGPWACRWAERTVSRPPATCRRRGLAPSGPPRLAGDRQPSSSERRGAVSRYDFQRLPARSRLFCASRLRRLMSAAPRDRPAGQPRCPRSSLLIWTTSDCAASRRPGIARRRLVALREVDPETCRPARARGRRSAAGRM